MDEPHFGEVWKWQDMGPFMVLAMKEEHGGSRTVVMANLFATVISGRITQLYWYIPGRDFRKDWHRMDEGELV